MIMVSRTENLRLLRAAKKLCDVGPSLFSACSDLLRAIGEAQTALARLNDQNLSAERDALGYGIGVRVGDVMYGNIGSRNRLDFTVIGPAVNIASRLENLTKEVKRSVLFSKAFVERAGCESNLEDVGSYSLRGLSEPITTYAFNSRSGW